VSFNLWPIQRRGLDEVSRGLEEDIHEFLFLKGRQIGETTKNDAFRIYWPQVNAGTQGMFVSNSDENRDYRRDVCLEMLNTLPPEYRLPVRVNNRNLLAWPHPNGSRLMFEAAGARDTSDLGRSRGLNFLDADEIGLWRSAKDVEALRASLSRRNPQRLYLWNGTAQGFNVLHDLYLQCEKSVTMRLVFLAWYHHHLYRVEEGTTIWNAYSGRLTSEERLWMREVKRRFSVDLEPEQMVWYRYCLDDICLGDETMRAQEFPCLPEEAFQSFGDKFFAQGTIRKLHVAAKSSPKPTGYLYEPGQHFDETKATPCSPAKANLLVWHEPENDGAYIVAGHAWGSSSPDAQHWVAEVFRAWPDQMQQVAEYSSETGTTYGFAWLLLYLAGAYRTRHALPWIINETEGPGKQVTREIRSFLETGYGLSPDARKAGLQDVYGCFRYYFWSRPDNMGAKAAPIDIEVHGTYRPYVLHALADTVVRGKMGICSPRLIDSLAALRRGETGDADEIGGGGGASDAHAMTAAMAVRCWQDDAMYDLTSFVMPKDEDKHAPRSVAHWIVQEHIQRTIGGRRWART